MVRMKKRVTWDLVSGLSLGRDVVLLDLAWDVSSVPRKNISLAGFEHIYFI